ncbi:hypothetical protein ACOMHN_064464 [Nucella lapillus]
MMRKKKWINWDTEKEAMELCLAVYFRSTSAYAVLRSVGFQLPHQRTLRRRFSTVLTGVGLCQSLFEMMRLRTLALEEHEKRVTLSLDGMTVTKALTYSHHRDELVGFVNCGEHHQSDEIADQAILVMIRGLTLKWKQVLGYFVAKHNLATPTLTAIISEIVRTVTGIGLYVDAIVMDQESCQWKWMKDMGVCVERPHVFHGTTQSFVMPDPPHLIKNLRNNFMTKYISFSWDGEKMIAKWCHLQELFSLETSGGSIRAAPKLKECHFTLPRGKKMKVILACQIFSHSVAAALKLYVSKSLMSEAALQTACFVETVNSMWDFVDSHSLSAPVGKKPVTRSDFEGDQVRFASFSNFVERWCFTNPKNDKLASNIPSNKGWLLVLSAMKGLSQKLIMEEEVLTHLCLRKCNQDHVENLHSQIRGYNGFNDHPTLPAYVNALRCLSCSSQTSELFDKTISAGANCQPDGEHGHHPIVNPCTADVECDAENADHADPIETNSFSCENNLFSSSFTDSEMELPPVESDIVQYIAGAVVRKFKQKNNCPLCVEKFTISANEAAGETPSLVSLVSLKEFKLGCLVLVSEPLLQVFRCFELHFRVATSKGLPRANPRQTIVYDRQKL